MGLTQQCKDPTQPAPRPFVNASGIVQSQNLFLNQETLHPEYHSRIYSHASGLFNTSMIYRPLHIYKFWEKVHICPLKKTVMVSTPPLTIHVL